MEKKLTLQTARTHLLLIWLIGGFLLLVPLIYQTLNATFERTTETGEESFAKDVWSWFLPLILPTVVLMLGSLSFNVESENKTAVFINKSTYIVCLVLSIFYLLLLFVHVYFWPAFSEQDPLKLFTVSNFYMPPLQGAAVLLISNLFNKKE